MKPTRNKAIIYLDHNATTPLDSEVAAAMRPFLETGFGNPSSGYSLGQEAREALEKARQEVAELLGCRAGEVVFTSGGSEADNLALKGLVDLLRPAEFHLVTSAVEHPAILNPACFLEGLGVRVSRVAVDRHGWLDPQAVERAITPRTRLISVMLANNETGTLLPLGEISRQARARGILVHTDAAQAIGKIPVDVNALGVDLLSVAGHKLYGPKGVGVLYIRDGIQLTPLIHGAGQEGGRRAGTENVLLAVGLGTACRVAARRLESDLKSVKALRDRLQCLLLDGIPGLVINGHASERLPNTLNVAVPGLEGGRILAGVPELAASTGAACHDRSVQLSHVLSAMGLPEEIGMGALRFSLGRENDLEQIERAAALIIGQVNKLRA